MAIKEEKLLKAISEMEAVAKGGVPGDTKGTSRLPKTTAEANGGLSNEGDKQELAAKGGDEDDFEDEVDEILEEDEGDEDADVEKAVADDESSSDEDESSSDDDDEDDKKPVRKCAKKSMSHAPIADLVKSTAAGSLVDASPFVETLVDQISDADMQLRKAIVEMHEEQDQFNTSLRKSVVAMGNLMLDISKKMNGMLDQPAHERKTALSKSEIADRFEPETPDFSKSEVLDAMFELVKSGRVDPIQVSRYESTNTMEPAVLNEVQTYLTKKSA